MQSFQVIFKSYQNSNGVCILLHERYILSSHKFDYEIFNRQIIIKLIAKDI